MSSAEQSVREGNLAQALEELQQRVRRNPGSATERAFLFQLLALQGQWERAAAQLKVMGDLDAGALITVQVYGPAIQCELLRAKVFGGEKTPLLLGEPERWMALLLEALKVVAAGRFEDAARLRAEAFEAAPAHSGTLDGQPFEWLADADPRLGPCLEVIVDGKYYWTPIANVRSLRLEPPADLRDLIWARGAITWVNGGEVAALLPVRYPGTESSAASDLHRLSRKTDWLPQAAETHFGIGQRMFATNGGEYPLLDVRQLSIGQAGGPS